MSKAEKQQTVMSYSPDYNNWLIESTYAADIVKIIAVSYNIISQEKDSSGTVIKIRAILDKNQVKMVAAR